jgi:hypothetical protein
MTLPDGSTRYAVKQVVNTAISSLTSTNGWFGIQQNIEGINCFDMMGRPAVLSFWFDCSTAGTYSVSLTNSPTTSSFLTSFTAVAGVQKITLAIPVFPTSLAIPATNAVGLFLRIGALNQGTWASAGNPNAWQAGTFITVTGATNWGSTANRYIGATEIQLESGSVASSFESRSYGQELVLCQRYYETGLAYIRAYFASGSFTLAIHVPYKAPKRASSTITFSSTTYLNASSVSAGANTNPYSFVALANVTTGGTDTFLNTAWAAESEL